MQIFKRVQPRFPCKVDSSHLEGSWSRITSKKFGLSTMPLPNLYLLVTLCVSVCLIKHNGQRRLTGWSWWLVTDSDRSQRTSFEDRTWCNQRWVSKRRNSVGFDGQSSWQPLLCKSLSPAHSDSPEASGTRTRSELQNREGSRLGWPCRTETDEITSTNQPQRRQRNRETLSYPSILLWVFFLEIRPVVPQCLCFTQTSLCCPILRRT